MLTVGVGYGIYLYKLDPKLLERRLLTREKVGEQKIIIKFVRALLVCSLWMRRQDPIPIYSSPARFESPRDRESTAVSELRQHAATVAKIALSTIC
jgi:hypothetical protein